jgi:Tfp pilus assembly protein PilO
MQSLKKQIIWTSRAQYALWASVFAGLVMFYGTHYQPLAASLGALNLNLDLARRDLAESRSQARQLPRVAADLAGLQKQIAQIKKLPTSPELGNFMEQMQQISRDCDLQNLNISFLGTTHRTEQFTQVPVDLQFDGDFLKIFSALQKTEQLPRLTRITGITIHHLDSTTGLVRVEMSLNLYYAEGT